MSVLTDCSTSGCYFELLPSARQENFLNLASNQNVTHFSSILPDVIKAPRRRTEFDVLAVANAISARGLPGDVYRAATVRTGKLVR